MEDKSVLQIISEIIMGFLFMVPFVINETNNYAHIIWIEVLFRLLYSFGIPIIIVKIMSLLYRFISVLVSNSLMKNDCRYFQLWFLFVVIGFCLWYRYLIYFQKGYIWAEIIGYIVASFWFLLDVNTTRCSRALKQISEKLGTELRVHRDFVEKYKKCVDYISKEKTQVVRDMNVVYDKTRFHDPCRNLNKDINIQYADEYLTHVPLYEKEYKGIAGLFDGMICIRKYASEVNKYIGKMEEDRKWMDKEINVYSGQIEKMQEQMGLLKRVQGNYAKMESIAEINDDNIEYYNRIIQNGKQMINKSTKNVNDVWKMNKRINKIRRKHYGK